MPFQVRQERLNKLSKLKSIIDYKPNFVLIPKDLDQQQNIVSNAHLKRTGSASILLSKIRDIVLAIWIVFIGVIKQTSSFLLYKTYTGVQYGVQTILQTPIYAKKVIINTKDLTQTISQTNTRELWILERRIDLKIFLRRVKALLMLSTRLVEKFYLLFVIVGVITLLNTNSINVITSSSNKSFIADFIKNNSSTPTIDAKPSSVSQTINTAATTLQNQSPVTSIIQHTISKEDNLEILANKYGISTETIKFNNNLQSEDLKIGTQLYIPWLDGYIYRTNSEESPENIGNIYGINQDAVRRENIAILNPNTDTFSKDSLVLIPTNDFTKITNVNNRISEEKKQAEEAARQKLLASQSISRTSQSTPTTPASTPISPTNTGFIWPTSGTITRCVQAGHVACDIANSSAPNVVSVQSGVVSAVYRYTVYGYGLAVVVDHGNGLQTLYAHLSDIYVSSGQAVSQGQALGRMGSTGNSTGIHLHFEVRSGGVQQNPLSYLP